MKMERNSSNVWPYVIAGSAIGGAIGYLFMTESGKKIRHTVTHPDELADAIEDGRSFIESKAKMVTGQVRGAIDKVEHGNCRRGLYDRALLLESTKYARS